MFLFPSAPTNGQVANGYTWDGEKWGKPAAAFVSDPTKVSKAGDIMSGELNMGNKNITNIDGVNAQNLVVNNSGAFVNLPGVINGTPAGGGNLEVRGAGTVNDAYMTFHRPGVYAVNFGLAADNNFYFGGYSVGALRYKFWTSQDGTPMFLAGNQTLTGGFKVTTVDAGTFTAGQTFTPNPALGNYQKLINNGAFTIASPTTFDFAMDVLVSNGATAGAITFSGFAVSSPAGDALTTTNGHRFILSIRRIGSFSTYVIKACQ